MLTKDMDSERISRHLQTRDLCQLRVELARLRGGYMLAMDILKNIETSLPPLEQLEQELSYQESLR